MASSLVFAVQYNLLAADARVPLSKESHHIVLNADLELGDTLKTAHFFAEAFTKAVGDPAWVPCDVQPEAEITVGHTSAYATRFWICALDLWLPRCLATIGRLWKRMGYENVLAALRNAVADRTSAHHTQSVLKAFTADLFAKVVEVTYTNHLERTSHAFFPGRFLDDSRTKALHNYVLSRFDESDLVPGPSFVKLVARLSVLSWAVLQLRPEAAAHWLSYDKIDDLVDPFLDTADPDPSFELIKHLRELWAEAPVNGGRPKIVAEKEAHVRCDKGCFCKAGSGCILGRAAQQRHISCFTQRAQPPAYHLARKFKSGQEQTNDEARCSGISLGCFLRDNQQMPALVKAAGSEGGEQEITALVHRRKRSKAADDNQHRDLGIYLISDVRATMFGRLLYSTVQHLCLHIAAGRTATPCQSIAIPGDPARFPHLADEPTKRVLAFVSTPSLGIGLTGKARTEIVSAVLAHSDHLLPCGEHLLPKLTKAWAAYMLKEHPELEFVLPILLEEMRLAYRWDPSNTEEVPCEIAKGLLGRLVEMGIVSDRNLMKGRYQSCLAAAQKCGLECDYNTPTQWPAVRCSLNRCLAKYIDENGQLTLSRGDYLPRLCGSSTSKGRGQQPASNGAAPDATRDPPSRDPHKSSQVLRQALAELRRARRLLHDATQVREAARDQAAAMEQHLKSLQDNKGIPNLTFVDLRDRVCHRDARLAYHIWAACTGSGKWTCTLHLDDLDLGLLLNLICSFGVSEHNEIVPLKGSLLLCLLAFSTKVRSVLSIL